MNKKKIALVSLFVGLFALLTSCGTVSGFGKDVAKTGREIQKAAS